MANHEGQLDKAESGKETAMDVFSSLQSTRAVNEGVSVALRFPSEADKISSSPIISRNFDSDSAPYRFAEPGIAKIVTIQGHPKGNAGSNIPKPRATRASILREESNKRRSLQAGSPSPVFRQLESAAGHCNVSSSHARLPQQRAMCSEASNPLETLAEDGPLIAIADTGNGATSPFDAPLNVNQAEPLTPSGQSISYQPRRFSQYCEKYGYVISETLDARLVIMGEDKSSQRIKNTNSPQSLVRPRSNQKMNFRELSPQVKARGTKNIPKNDRHGTDAIVPKLHRDKKWESSALSKANQKTARKPLAIRSSAKAQVIKTHVRDTSQSNEARKLLTNAPREENKMAGLLPLDQTADDMHKSPLLTTDPPHSSDSPTSIRSLFNRSSALVATSSANSRSLSPYDLDRSGTKNGLNNVRQLRPRTIESFGNVSHGFKEFGKKVSKIIPSRRNHRSENPKPERISTAETVRVTGNLPCGHDSPLLPSIGQSSNEKVDLSEISQDILSSGCSDQVESADEVEPEPVPSTLVQKNGSALEIHIDQRSLFQLQQRVTRECSVSNLDPIDRTPSLSSNEGSSDPIEPVSSEVRSDHALDKAISSAESRCRDLLIAATQTEDLELRRSFLDIASSMGSSIMATRNARMGVLHLEQMIGQVVVMLEASSIRGGIMINTSSL